MNEPLIPVVLCVDVEPDPRSVSRDSPEPWDGYEQARSRLEDLRAQLALRTAAPARFTWFLRFDDQIALTYGRTWVIDQHLDHLEAMREQGDALGIHVHPYRWLDDEETWLSDYGSATTTAAALCTSVATFADVWGEPPRLLRFGDGWMDTATMALAEQLGITVDLTLEPGTAPGPMRLPERSTGLHPDLVRLSRRPYAPDPGDFRRATVGGRTICALPLSSVRVRGRRPWRRPRISLAPWRHWTPRNPLPAMFTQALADSPRPYLAVAVRTGDLGSRVGLGPRIESFFAALLEHPAAERFVVCPPNEALERLGY